MALTVRHLNKYFGPQPALCDINFTLGGGVTALLGANGSGKSTLLRILATLCKPDRGEVAFNGLTYGPDQNMLRARIGYLPQEFEIQPGLTPRKFLRYLAQLREGDFRPVMDALALESFADQPFHKLSGGQLRLVGIAQALLGNPHLLLLDELNRGLDIVERERVYRLLAGSSRLTIFSTHSPEEVERIAQTVIILHAGRIRFCGPVDALLNEAVGQVYEITLARDALSQVMASLCISRITSHESQVLVRVLGNPPFPGAVPVMPSLEDAYLWLVHDEKLRLHGSSH